MSSVATQQLQRQLDEAVQKQKMMRDKHREMLHKVATSPAKQKKPSPRQEEEEQRKEIKVIDLPEVPAVIQKKSSGLNIPAYRPEEKATEVEKISEEPTVQVEEYESPAFLTVRKKAMHCELDEPGYDIPFPKNMQKKSLFQRIFGCFHTPSIYSPPRVMSHRPRPQSSGVVPPLLTLENEVAPLKLSMCDYQEFCTVVKREESFESLVAEVSDAGDTPVAPRHVTKQDDIAESIAPVQLKKYAVSVAEKSAAPRGRTYSSRLPAETSVARAETAAETASVGQRSRTVSPLKAPRNQPRMTKATLARNEANRKKIEERNIMESRHFEAMPTAIKRASMPLGDTKSFLPKFRQSLATFDTAKQASIESAAVKVLFPQNTHGEEHDMDEESISGRNHMMSLSFTEDPFYKELAKIDHTLTQDDFEKLREALLVMD